MTLPDEEAGQEVGQAQDKAKRRGKKPTTETPLNPEILSAILASSGSGKMTMERRQETEEEEASRLRIEEANAEAQRQETKTAADAERQEKKAAMDHRRKIELCALAAYIAISTIACIACFWILTDKKIVASDKAWVGPTLTLIIGGLAGFMSGRLPGRTSEK